jgi:hypothetical protein
MVTAVCVNSTVFKVSTQCARRCRSSVSSLLIISHPFCQLGSSHALLKDPTVSVFEFTTGLLLYINGL